MKDKRYTTETGLLFHQQKTLQTRLYPNPERPECWFELLNLLVEVGATRLIYSFSFVLLQCLLLALYRIVLPVLILYKTVKFLRCKLTSTTLIITIGSIILETNLIH